jgi:hypothetical protein
MKGIEPTVFAAAVVISVKNILAATETFAQAYRILSISTRLAQPDVMDYSSQERTKNFSKATKSLPTHFGIIYPNIRILLSIILARSESFGC